MSKSQNYRNRALSLSLAPTSTYLPTSLPPLLNPLPPPPPKPTHTRTHAKINMSFDSPLPPYNSSDPSATFLNASCWDLLMIEIVPMAYRLTSSTSSTTSPHSSRPSSLPPPSSTTSHSTNPNPPHEVEIDEEETRDAVFYRLDMLGYRVGQGLVERFSKDRPRFTDTLDVIKFLCKEVWMLVFRKHVDNLKTNHRVGLFLPSPSVRFRSRSASILQEREIWIYLYRWMDGYCAIDRMTRLITKTNRASTY